MKERNCKWFFSILLAFTVFLTTMPIEVFGEIDCIQKESIASVTEDGIYEEWRQEQTTVKGTGSICEITDDGYLHLKAGSENGMTNDYTSSCPAIFETPYNYDFTEAGHFEFEYIQLSASSNSRAGLYFDYGGIGNGMFLGYDGNGWYWQKYVIGNPEHKRCKLYRRWRKRKYLYRMRREDRRNNCGARP